jgi:hypothetical protein
MSLSESGQAGALWCRPKRLRTHSLSWVAVQEAAGQARRQARPGSMPGQAAVQARQQDRTGGRPGQVAGRADWEQQLRKLAPINGKVWFNLLGASRP